MKPLGLSAEELFQTGYNEYMSLMDYFMGCIFKNSELFKNAGVLRDSLESAKQEALLKTVSVMISKNNQVLLEQLTGAGILHTGNN